MPSVASNRRVQSVQQKLLPERKRKKKKRRVCSNDHGMQAKWNALWITSPTESSLHFLSLIYRLYIISSGAYTFGTSNTFATIGEIKSPSFKAIERTAEYTGVRLVSFTVCGFRNHWLEWIESLMGVCVKKVLKWYKYKSLIRISSAFIQRHFLSFYIYT